MNDNIHMLAGPYALDALPGEERAFFERHLAGCDACRREVAEYADTAALLGAAAWERPPAGMRERVLDTAARTRQLPPLLTESPATLADRLQPLLAPAAAFLAAVAVGLGGLSVILWQQRGLSEEEIAALMATGQVIELTAPEGAAARFVYSPERDEGLLVVHGLAPLEADQDYQAWLFHDGSPEPAGVFDVGDDGMAVLRVQAPVRGAEVVAVTVEPTGGLPAPSGDVLLLAEL